MKENSRESKFFSSILKGVATAVIITLMGILAFAFVIKMAHLNAGVIKAVNQFIKVLSIFLGCFSFVRGGSGLIKGVLIGGFTAVIVYMIFALMGGELLFGGAFIIDLIFQAIIGGISGVIAVNVKK